MLGYTRASIQPFAHSGGRFHDFSYRSHPDRAHAVAVRLQYLEWFWTGYAATRKEDSEAGRQGQQRLS